MLYTDGEVIALPIHIKLKEQLQKKGITQKQLAELTGLHESTLSEFARGSRNAINKHHLERIMNALGITDFNDMLNFEQE